MENTGTEYGAPWGNLLKIISAAVTMLLLGIFLWIPLHGGQESSSRMLPYVIFPLILIGGGLLFTIRGYVLCDTTLLVKRLLWNTEIRLGVIRSAEHDPRAMTGAIRTWGNGGLYSFSGRFRSARLGSFRAYVTDYGNAVIIRTASGTVVVSPGDPQRFVEALRNRIQSR